MLNIVLSVINAKYVHSSLSVWVIAEGINCYSRYLHNINVVEATINQKTTDIVDSIAKHKPDIIGISSYIWNAAMMPELLILLRKRMPGVIIVLGGPEATNNIDYWLNNGADHVLPGEGEYVFPQFLDGLIADSSQNNKDPVQNPDYSECNFINPYSGEYFNTLSGRLSYIETSRGCPFKCAFCLSAGTGVRYFPLDIVKDQISALSQSNTKTIKFVDRTFNCNPERAYEIFDYVIKLNTKCTFHFEVAADLFNEKMLYILEKAPPGRIQFEIGLQSFYEPALKAASRKSDISKAVTNIFALIEMQNIHIHIDLIAGLPYETLPEFITGFDRAFTLGAHHLQLGFLKMLHGSELRNKAKNFGIQYSPEPPYEIISSPWLSIEDLHILKKTENALQNTYNKGRFLSTLHYVLTVTGLKPFILMNLLGTSVSNQGTQLENYAIHLYDFFLTLPHVEATALQDCMACDWLAMVKGKNAPAFMKNKDIRRNRLFEITEKVLKRKPKREEYSILNSGIGIFVDSNEKNPITGLYKVYHCKLTDNL